MIGGTSRGELWVVDGDDDDGAGDGGEEVEGVRTCDSCDADDTDALSAVFGDFSLSELSVASLESDVDVVSLPLASAFRETPRRLSISSPCSPFDSKKAILRPVASFLIESSSRNLAACSRRVDREEVVSLSSEVCDGVSEAEELDSVLFACCHAGMDGFFDSSSAMMPTGEMFCDVVL